jgi:hypothetical protein
MQDEERVELSGGYQFGMPIATFQRDPISGIKLLVNKGADK